MTEDCVFCKIINGKIPCIKIYEDDDVFVFFDAAPVNLGHTLVIPKKHSHTLLQTDDEILAKLIKVVKKIAESVMKAVKADGFNVEANNYRAADQIVPHLHFHIVPRFKNDGKRTIGWGRDDYNKSDEKIIADKIRKLL